jgi:hypothetical protein
MMQASVSRESISTAPVASGALLNEHRQRVSTPLNLIEIDRATVVDAVRLDDGSAASESDAVFAVGEMRELCPRCQIVHLKLILRQKRVHQSHLFCDGCEKCFDARYLDGTPALDIEY